MTRIAIGSDHAGFDLKQHLVALLRAQGHQVDDQGTFSTDSVDYPPICAGVGRTVRDGQAEVGIVLGGSGQGEQLAANKVRGVRAALYMAAMSASRSNPQIRAFAERLKARGKKPMQVLCAVMRKLLLMARAVVVGDREYSPHYPGGAACVAPPAPDMIPDARSEDRATPEGDPSAATGPKTQGWGADTFHAPSHPPLRIGRNAVNSGGLGAKPPRTRPKDAVPTRQKRAGKTVQKT